MARSMPARAPASHPASRHTDAATGHAVSDVRFEILDKALTRARYASDHLVEILHVAQQAFGYLSPDVLAYLARELRLPASTVFGVATFYHLFSFDPPGEHLCTVCTGTACFVKGADGIVAALQDAYGLSAGQTLADGRLTLRIARCLGSCGMAPVTVIDGAVSGHQTAASVVYAVQVALASEKVG